MYVRLRYYVMSRMYVHMCVHVAILICSCTYVILLDQVLEQSACYVLMQCVYVCMAMAILMANIMYVFMYGNVCVYVCMYACMYVCMAIFSTL
jgi:uncharacterized membrane protein